MIFSFTGPSHLTPAQEEWCRHELAALAGAPDTTWRSGGAYGLDTLVTEAGAPFTIFAPAGEPWNASLAKMGAPVIEVPGGYRARNTALVTGSDLLHAFLFKPTFYRSGEWMTVNIARRLGVDVEKHIIPRFDGGLVAA